MAQVIDLEGLPDPVAKAIAETVLNLKSRYRTQSGKTTKALRDLPSRPGKVIGSLRTWPQSGDAQGKVVLSHEERSLLLGGIDLTKTKHKRWYRKTYPEGHAAA